MDKQLAEIITRDMVQMVLISENKAKQYRYLMERSPESKDWDRWLFKAEAEDQRVARFLAALARRALEEVADG